MMRPVCGHLTTGNLQYSSPLPTVPTMKIKLKFNFIEIQLPGSEMHDYVIAKTIRLPLTHDLLRFGQFDNVCPIFTKMVPNDSQKHECYHICYGHISYKMLQSCVSFL